MFIDLGAVQLVAAEKEEQRIAVEIKGFSGPSEMTELKRAIGFDPVEETISRWIS